jgi:hypothetical protein
MFMVIRPLAVAALLLLAACSGGGQSVPDASVSAGMLRTTQSVSDDAASDAVTPYTPGIDAEPDIARAPLARAVTSSEIGEQARFAAELSNPNRPVFHPRSAGTRPQSVVAGGNGEAVGLFTSSTFSANGSVVNFGVQKDYVVGDGGNFFHTHQFVNNQCFEYGINYAAQAPTLFAYNWCTGGNTPQGFMNVGLVGDPGGALNTWDATGNGWLFKWDALNKIYEISLEEVKKTDGWHLLGYNWAKTKFVDLMNGRGVTGKKNACCGWSVFEVHVTPGASCKFDPAFPKGANLLYDTKMQALIGSTWTPLNKIPNGGFNFGSKIDCANISGQADPAYVSPYFSGGFVAPTATVHPGDWWMIQR